MATSTSPARMSPTAAQVLAAYAAHFVAVGGVHAIVCPPARELRRLYTPRLSRKAWARGTTELHAAGLLRCEHMAGRWVTGALLPRDLASLRTWAWAVSHVASQLPDSPAGAR